jgi:hypothetical protein
MDELGGRYRMQMLHGDFACLTKITFGNMLVTTSLSTSHIAVADLVRERLSHARPFHIRRNIVVLCVCSRWCRILENMVRARVDQSASSTALQLKSHRPLFWR